MARGTMASAVAPTTEVTALPIVLGTVNSALCATARGAGGNVLLAAGPRVVGRGWTLLTISVTLAVILSLM